MQVVLIITKCFCCYSEQFGIEWIKFIYINLVLLFDLQYQELIKPTTAHWSLGLMWILPITQLRIQFKKTFHYIYSFSFFYYKSHLMKAIHNQTLTDLVSCLLTHSWNIRMLRFLLSKSPRRMLSTNRCL